MPRHYSDRFVDDGKIRDGEPGMQLNSTRNPVLYAGRRSRRSEGFSLVEVMVALVVCCVGLLGLAKMEALSISSTGIAGARSLAAIEASSLAAAMHADRGYWGG